MSQSDNNNILAGLDGYDNEVVLTDEVISEKPKEEEVKSNTLNDIITFYKRFKNLLKKYWYLAILLSVFGGLLTVYYFLNRPTSYVANLTFMLQEENEPNAQGASAISAVDPLASFLLTRVTTQAISLDRLKDISLSQKVITNMLFNKCIIKGKEDFLANHYLKIYYGYGPEAYFRNFRGLNSLKREEYLVFKQIMGTIRAGNVSIEQTKSGAYLLNIATIDEELSKVMCELFYQNLSNFYIDKTTEKAQRNYIFLRNRLDSVRNLLYSTEYTVANFEDRSHNLLLTTARVPQSRQYRNTEYYTTIYGETLKSFEASKVALNNITPVFQVLDRPFYPLFSERFSGALTLFIGVIATFFFILIVFAIIYFKVYMWPKYKSLIQKANDDVNLSNLNPIEETSLTDTNFTSQDNLDTP
jgi:hypothetical protein